MKRIRQMTAAERREMWVDHGPTDEPDGAEVYRPADAAPDDPWMVVCVQNGRKSTLMVSATEGLGEAGARAVAARLNATLKGN